MGTFLRKIHGDLDGASSSLVTLGLAVFIFLYVREKMVSTWRIIPFSKWLTTMVIVSPGCGTPSKMAGLHGFKMSYKAWDDPLRRRHHQTGNYWVGDMLKNRKKIRENPTKHHQKKTPGGNGLKRSSRGKQKKARNYTPPKIYIEPEVMMLWFRCFSEFPGV